MQQPELIATKAYLNTGLFVDYFLSEKLPQEGIWKEALSDEKTKEIFYKLKALYESKKDVLSTLNEAQTEEEFIRPILDLLGFKYIVQTPTKAMGRSLIPDYALFDSDESKKKGYDETKKNNYSNVLAIADAKYWNRPLDMKIMDVRDTLTNQNPSFQISSYILGTKAEWAVLTNGKLWRLYSREYSQTMAEYFQVDLEEILKSGSLNDFLYFFLFFRKQAFQVVEMGSILNQVIRESIEYGSQLQENLKSLIFEKIFKYLAQGFVNWRQKNGIEKETQETFIETFDNTLILLYRLLFILYAEARDLLPVKERDRYYTKSLSKIKGEIKNDIEKNVTLSPISTDYWDDLTNLFHIIDSGDSALNIPKYNGGLFSKMQHKFLEENKIADAHLEEAIYLLATYFEPTKHEWVFVDYKSLGVRQLGSIYEGLLEFHLQIADQELVIVKEKGKEKYVPVSEIKSGQRDTGERVKPGEIYLENTKAERKATGSYYTPGYIVDYIVENTVGPLIDDIEKQFDDKKKELKSRSKFRSQSAKWKTHNLSKWDPALKSLELKICDPAMGSGHFLVTTVDFIANRIFDLLNKHSEQIYFGKEVYESPLFQQIQDIRENILAEMDRQKVTIDAEKLEDDKVIIRRMVMKRCIFGVDLNYLAVELAKLSLWLNSFTLGAPLSFLDHHLRWGNSLIGSNIEEVQEEMKKSLFGSKFAGLISATDAMFKIGELTDSTFAELQESQKDYNLAIEWLAPYKKVLDIWTSQYFGNNGAKDLIDQGRIDPDSLESSLAQLTEKELQIINFTEKLQQEKRFFHWELEFPEVYYNAVGRKGNAGFDSVISNPPYVFTRGEHFTDQEKRFFNLDRKTNTSKGNRKKQSGKLNLYALFIEHGIQLVRNEGSFGFITPNTLLRTTTTDQTRKFILDNMEIVKIVDLSSGVFQDVTASIIIIILRKEKFNGKVQVISNVADYAFTSFNQHTVNQDSFHKNPSFAFDIYTNDAVAELIEKIMNITFPLGLIAADIIEGIVTQKGKAQFISRTKDSAKHKPFLEGKDVGRYLVNWTGKYIFYDRELLHRARQETIFLCPEKILIQRISGGSNVITAAYDNEQFYTFASINNLLVKDRIPINMKYILSLLNSRLLNFIYRSKFSSRSDLTVNVSKTYLEHLPMRRITFITPPRLRNKELNKAKDLYDRYLQFGDQNEKIEILDFISYLLEKKHKPDIDLLKKHDLDPLNNDYQISEGELWEQSDVVHDNLVYLAEKMIKMNKQKQEEISGFNKYLEHIIGIEVENLANKSLLLNYYNNSFDQVLAVLQRNQNKLQGFNSKSRSDQENLEKEFNKSRQKLESLKAGIELTDCLIDQIVYKLYGLTEEEIRLVEAE